GNVVVTTTGRVTVLDFGLAKLMERTGPDEVTITAKAATRTAAIVGTVAYASPGPIEAKPEGARSVVSSAGAMFYDVVACLRRCCWLRSPAPPYGLPGKVPVRGGLATKFCRPRSGWCSKSIFTARRVCFAKPSDTFLTIRS